ncbi:glycosyltransferase family 4 protein [Clostridiaceae bacterium 14S0207]|nr:glycosyltransferase family 4 protein [Clostridiaceae bacterium 14S0207]
MKILITSDTYFPIVNGVVISTNNLYKELKKLGHDVKILTLSTDGESKIDGDIYYLKSLETKIYPGARVGNPFFSSITKEIIKWKPDIIHSQTEFTTMVVAKIIAKKLHIPQVHTYHTMYEDYLHYLWGGKLLSKRLSAKLTSVLLNSMECVITPTKKVEETLLGYGTHTETSIIPTGIDLSKFKEKMSEEEKNNILQKHGIPKEGKKIMYIGRIAEEKNIEEIINFYSEFCEYENVSLVIVGGGPYLKKLRQEVDSLNINDKVFFTDMVKPSEVHKYYKIGDIFVTASTSETQGLTYIEALSSGLPVICRWDPCISHLVINEHNGYTYKTKDEFKRSVIKLLRNDELLKELSNNSILRTEAYSSKHFACKVEETYKKVLDRLVELGIAI